MNAEFPRTPSDDYGQRLLAKVDAIKQWADGRNSRGSHEDTTSRKVTSRLGELTNEFMNTATYVNAPLVLIPYEDGSLAVGMGEVTGELVGFNYGKYPLTNEGETNTGIIALIAVSGASDEGHTTKTWGNILPHGANATIIAAYAQTGTVPVLIPIVEGVSFTEVHNTAPLSLSVSDIINAPSFEATKDSFDHRAFVTRIEKLMKGRYLMHPVADRALVSALQSEMSALLEQCPYLGQYVAITADYMLTPSPIDPEKHRIIRGTAHGVLRKFIYAPYFPDRKNMPGRQARGTVQAVVYQSDVAKRVTDGSLSATDADKMTGTVFIPLDQEHELRQFDV